MENIRGSHTFSREPNFSENEKVGREKGSQWGVPVHGGCVTPRFAVASMENGFTLSNADVSNTDVEKQTQRELATRG